MAITIADNIGKITFVVGASTYNVNKSDIKSIDLNNEKSRIEVRVASGYITGNYIFITYSDVTSPTDKSVGLLFKTIRDWWKEPHKKSCMFISDVSQTAFDVTPRLKLSDDSTVMVDQQLQTYGWSYSGNIITFDLAMTGNEEIVVFQ